MTTDIKPKQLRALLVLLFLLPLVPVAMMARFLTDSLRGERSMAVERFENYYGSALGSALGEDSPPASAAAALDRVRQFVDDAVTIRVVDEKGALLAGEKMPHGQPVAQAGVPGHPGWLAVLHFKSDAPIAEAVSEQRGTFIWTVSLTALLVTGMAGITLLAVRRQLALNDLKNTSVATVAHELRTPLASMRLLVDTLREGRYRGDAQLREYLDLIAAENDRLGRLAENFLTFSRLDRGANPLTFTTIAPGEIATAAADRIRPRLPGKGCDFALEIAPTIPLIRADRDALAAALVNLLDNALKYTGDEKNIRLCARPAAAGGVAFSVADNGIGISEADRESIFRPFFQADQRLSRSREGCGLGLTIVREIAAAHGGKITIAKRDGGGSVFTIIIPGEALAAR